MPIHAKPSENTFVLVTPGLHPAVCVDVVDLGMVDTEYNGKTKKKPMIRIVWQVEETKPDSDVRLTLRRMYHLSAHENATLRKDLESWRGKRFHSEEEMSDLDIEKLIGVGCYINCIHEPGKDGKVFANVDSVMPLPKGVTALTAVGYTRECDRKEERGQPRADGLVSGPRPSATRPVEPISDAVAEQEPPDWVKQDAEAPGAAGPYQATDDDLPGFGKQAS